MPALEASPPEPRILLVDDDACFRRSLAIALRLEGLVVIEASDGHQALEQVRQQRFGLAVVGQWLGIDRGDEVLDEIRRLSPATRLATTCTHPAIGSTMAARGLAVQLNKPICPSDILALL